MSIANLFTPNNYTLYCGEIKSDGYDVVTKSVSFFSNTGVNIFGGPLTLSYVIRNGICTMWISTTTTATLAVNANYTSIYMAETVGGYVTFPCPDTIGEKIFLPVTVLTQGTTTNRDGLLELDCNSGGLDQGRLTITLNPDITTGGSTPNFTYTKIDGSDLFNIRFALYGWSISYPVEAT